MKILLLLVVLIVLPILLLIYFTQSRKTRILRMRRNGYKWQRIADKYQVSTSTVRRWSVA